MIVSGSLEIRVVDGVLSVVLAGPDRQAFIRFPEVAVDRNAVVTIHNVTVSLNVEVSDT